MPLDSHFSKPKLSYNSCLVCLIILMRDLSPLSQFKNFLVFLMYPKNLPDHWIKDHFQKHWNNRLSLQSVREKDGFVLKSKFNPAWTLSTSMSSEILSHSPGVSPV